MSLAENSCLTHTLGAEADVPPMLMPGVWLHQVSLWSAVRASGFCHDSWPLSSLAEPVNVLAGASMWAAATVVAVTEAESFSSEPYTAPTA